ncbi:MAG: hypothetical protein QOJ42_3054 [Acidobacteriaceae bacterium]|nr:hypothetical protein [Acidobacteriaceae bacterium]
MDEQLVKSVETAALRTGLRRTRFNQWLAGNLVARLPLRRARFRRSGFDPGASRSEGHRPVHARVRPNSLRF